MPSYIAHPPILETSLIWHSEDDTALAAVALAQQPVIANAFITLQGDLGAGKTSFARHLLRALGVTGRIKSPTYALVEPYEVLAHHHKVPIWHCDLYRLQDPREWWDAGLRELLTEPGLKLVEWPERAADLLPPPDVHITLTVEPDDARHVRLAAYSQAGATLISSLS